MHDPATCGEMFDEVEAIHGFAVPTHMLSENGQLKLREQVGASNLAICCMCIERFRLPCLLKGATTQAATSGLEVIEGGPPAPIESIYQDSVEGKSNMKLESVGDGDEAPKPSAYASAQYDEMDAAIKRAVKNTSQMSPPVPPAAEARIAAMVEDTEIENKRKAFLSPDGVGGNGREPHVLTPKANLEQQNALSADPVQSAASGAQAQQKAPITTRPPPRSMLPSNLKSTPSLPVLQATLVEDEPQAPVYDAIPLQSSGDQSVPWWKRRAVLCMGSVIVLLVVTLGAVIGILGDGSNGENTESGVDLTAGPGEEEDNTTNSGANTEVTVLNSFQPSQLPSQVSLFSSENVFACQCSKPPDCSPNQSILTQYRNEAKICIFSAREIVFFESLSFQGNKPYQVIDDGQSAVNDPDSLHVETGGSQAALGLQAVVDVDLPWEFFEGMPESPMPGKVLGIASVKSALGGISEVGFNADLQFMYQAQSNATTVGALIGLIGNNNDNGCSLTGSVPITAPACVPLSPNPDDFEGGVFPLPPWSTGGDGVWALTTDKAFDGSNSLKSPIYEGATNKIVSNATLQVCDDFTGGLLKFNAYASVEPPHDIFIIYVDGLEAAQMVDKNDWEPTSLQLTAGPHVVEFSYQYNLFGMSFLPENPASREGAVWLDAVQIVSVSPPTTNAPTAIPDGAVYYNSFEKRSLDQYPECTSTGDGDWFVTDEQANSGVFSVRSPALTDTGSANVTCTTSPDNPAGELKFFIWSSVWIPLDSVSFYVDGDLQSQYLRQTAFQEETTQLSPGQHTITFEHKFNPNNFPPNALPPSTCFPNRLGAVFVDDLQFVPFDLPDEFDLLLLDSVNADLKSDAPTKSPTIPRGLVYDEIGARLALITPGGIDTLMDRSTPHNRALQWLIYEDGMELGPSEDHLHQRYVLMVIYFISGPWIPVEGHLEWGSPVHECEWEGIYCIDKEELDDELGGCTEESLEVGREDGIKIHVPQRIANRLHLRQRLVSGVVPAEISLLYYLQHLDLENNNLIGALPVPLYKLFNLQTLFLEQNQLTNVDAIGEYRHLEHLALSGNNFQGPLADSFRNLKKLKTLYLHTNGFTGEVWDVLKTFEQMELLDIAFNEFEGTISSEIGNMKNLTSVFLGHNNFVGEIPKELAQCKNLKQLQIDGSHDIGGTIPTFLGQLSKLEFIKLDTCAFTGTLPISLGNLEKLEFLDVNSNELQGRIPSQLGNATSLKTLGLANNDFSGGIPSELGKLTKLEKAYFQNTNIEGIMPDEVCALRDETVLEVLFVPCAVECDIMCCTNCS